MVPTYPGILSGLLEKVSELDQKVGVLHALLDEQSPESLRAAPVIYGPLGECLLSDILLTLAKLYDRKADRSVFRLLSTAQQAEIPWKTALEASALSRHDAMIKDLNTTLNSIRSRRNKAIAHYDKVYFDAPTRLEDDFPLSAREVIAVLEATQKILSEHSLCFDGSLRVSVGVFARVATLQMLTDLAAASEQRGRHG